MNMPQLCDFDPRPAALRWIEEKDRLARERTKADKQDWFSKVFANGNKEDGEVEEKELKREF